MPISIPPPNLHPLSCNPSAFMQTVAVIRLCLSYVTLWPLSSAVAAVSLMADFSVSLSANNNNNNNNNNKKYVLSNSESVKCNFFHFWSRDVHPVQNLLHVYKILWKSDDFSLRYGDISIFKMAAVRHLGIVLLPYETNHEVSVAGCSCLSKFVSIWYTDLKI